MVGDFNGDSWPDVLILDDSEPGRARGIRNDRGRPVRFDLDPDLLRCEGARLLHVLDYDLDQDLDIVCRFSDGYHALRNDGAFAFYDEGRIDGYGSTSGITDKSSATVPDLDNDGREELIGFGGLDGRTRCNVVVQSRAGRLEVQPCGTVFAGGWSSDCAGRMTGDVYDYDNDGDLDLVGVANASCSRSSARLMRNDTGGIYRSLRVRVKGLDGNPGCMGCRLELREGGTLVAQRSMQMRNSFTHSRLNVVGHLGAGTRAQVDLIIIPPSDRRAPVTFPAVRTGQTVVVDLSPATPTLTEHWRPGTGF
ncbi:MAG: hypothetical protein AAGF12_10340 [Myxococcota bacterium]